MFGNLSFFTPETSSSFSLNFVRLSYHKITNMQKNKQTNKRKKQVTIELGNAAQKGRYERETHAR